uniref:Uncharacterized protein n=1 Tax=Electrophorus electricus TaxID=8005 RepID=A0AAY5EY76_ELEEL
MGVSQVACLCLQLREEVHRSKQQGWEAEHEAHKPDCCTGSLGLSGPSPPAHGHGPRQGPVAVQADQVDQLTHGSGQIPQVHIGHGAVAPLDAEHGEDEAIANNTQDTDG